MARSRRSRKSTPVMEVPPGLTPEQATNLAALKALVVSGEKDRILQAVELLVSLGDAALMEWIAEGISFDDKGVVLVTEKSRVNAWLDEWVDDDGKPYFKAKTEHELDALGSIARKVRNWTAWRLGTAAGRLRGARAVTYVATGRTDLAELWSATDVRSVTVRDGDVLKDLSALEALPLLETVTLEVADGVSFEPLARCNRLRALSIKQWEWREDDPLTSGSTLDLSWFAPHAQLEELEVRGFRVTGGLSELHGCSGLRRLNVVLVPGS